MCIQQCKRGNRSGVREREKKRKEKEPSGSGQLWDLLIREVKVHNLKEVCEIFFLTLPIAVTLQAQTRLHQTDCFPISQWEARLSPVVPVMHHRAVHYSWVDNYCPQGPGRLDLEGPHRPEEDAKAAKEGLQHLLDLQTAGT